MTVKHNKYYGCLYSKEEIGSVADHILLGDIVIQVYYFFYETLDIFLRYVEYVAGGIRDMMCVCVYVSSFSQVMAVMVSVC